MLSRRHQTDLECYESSLGEHTRIYLVGSKKHRSPKRSNRVLATGVTTVVEPGFFRDPH